AAFELLVRRHADAVWAACRRVLRNDPDADDAFQTAFLVLVRKADAVRGPCVGGWLHRVAVNAALKLKASGRRAPASLPAGLGLPALGVALAAPVTAVSSAVAVAAGSVPPSPVVSTLAQGVLSAMRTARLKLTAIMSAAVLGMVGVGTAFAWQRATVPLDGLA